MKILHIINTLNIGGAEKLLVDLALKFNEQGQSVDILLLNGKDSFLLRRLEEANIKVMTLGKKTNIYNPLLIFRLIPYLKKYDIIHAHLFPVQYWVAFASLFISKKTILLTTEHSTYNRRRAIKPLRLVDKFVYKRYATIIAISEQTQEALQAYLPHLDKLTIIENGIDTAAYRVVTEEKSVVKEHFILIQIAGFKIQKDQQTVVRALQYLPEDIHLWLVGTGELQAEVLQVVEDLNLTTRVKFLGVRDDIPALLHQSDIVVMSSHWEGFGLAALEGMAAGKPVIASDVPGLREVVKDAGFLFELHDEKALAEAITTLYHDKAIYQQTATACSQRALAYDISKMAERYLSLYQNLLDEEN